MREAAAKKLRRASLFLAAAAALGFLSQRLFADGRSDAGIAVAVGALALSLQVLYWSAPDVLRFRRIRSVRLPRGAPLTLQGFAFVVLTLLVAGAAAYSANNLLYLVLSAMLGALLVSGFVSKLALAGLELRLALPDHIFAGRPVLARIAVKNLKSWLGSYSVRLSGAGANAGLEMESVFFPALAPNEEAVAAVEALFTRRGRHVEESVVLETRFPFGFSERRTQLHLSQGIVVYPNVDPTPESEALIAQLERRSQGKAPGDSHDLYRVRPAVPGDEARYMHWKASARGAGLQVREFAREDYLRVRLLFDRRIGDDDEARDRFEGRVALCAAVVWRLSELGAETSLISDEISLRARPSSPEVYELMRYLGAVEPAPAEAAGPSAEPPDAVEEQAAEHLFADRAVSAACLGA